MRVNPVAESNVGGGNRETQWYAVRVRSRFEKIAAEIVAGKGYEAFLPVHKLRRRWSDRIKFIEAPLFAGYFFSRFDGNQRLPILSTTGVLYIVGSGERLAPVDAAEIEAIRTAVISGFPMQPCAFLKTGQKVHIHDGPLKGLDGIIEYQKSQCRLVLSVTLLQRSITVEIDQSWASPIAEFQRPAIQRPAQGPFQRISEGQPGQTYPASYPRMRSSSSW